MYHLCTTATFRTIYHKRKILDIRLNIKDSRLVGVTRFELATTRPPELNFTFSNKFNKLYSSGFYTLSKSCRLPLSGVVAISRVPPVFHASFPTRSKLKSESPTSENIEDYLLWMLSANTFVVIVQQSQIEGGVKGYQTLDAVRRTLLNHIVSGNDIKDMEYFHIIYLSTWQIICRLRKRPC